MATLDLPVGNSDILRMPWYPPSIGMSAHMQPTDAGASHQAVKMGPAQRNWHMTSKKMTPLCAALIGSEKSEVNGETNYESYRLFWSRALARNSVQ